MKPFLPLAGVILLSACGGPVPGARPDVVYLSGDRLVVVFTDGVTCRADFRQAPDGRMPDCPHPLDYSVQIDRESHLRALGGLFAPYATITLGDGTGWQESYRTPEARDGPLGDWSGER
jgi:hypothetical protein